MSSGNGGQSQMGCFIHRATPGVVRDIDIHRRVWTGLHMESWYISWKIGKYPWMMCDE